MQDCHDTQPIVVLFSSQALHLADQSQSFVRVAQPELGADRDFKRLALLAWRQWPGFFFQGAQALECRAWHQVGRGTQFRDLLRKFAARACRCHW